MMRAVVCGAGIAGLALAHRLATAGAAVVLLERAPGPRTQGYMIDFFGAGYDAAEAMGVLPGLRAVSYRVTEARYVDDHGRRRASLSFDQFATALGGRLFSIMRPDLERVLREQLPGGVTLRFGAELVGVEQRPGGVRVTLADGSTLDADLLVGADGIHSTVRGAVFGPQPRFLHYLGYHTAAFTVADDDLRAAVADRFCLTDTVRRQVGVYGLRDGRVAAFTVHRTADPALPADPRAAVLREYGDLGWVVPRLLAQCPPNRDLYYDQVAQIVLPRWSDGRVVLLGDACGAVSLLAGQGASLAIGGAFVLAEELAGAPTIDDALRRYEQAWRPVVEEKQRVARGIAPWFVPGSRPQLLARRVAMRLSGVPGLRRLFTGAVAGKEAGLIRELATRARA